MEQQQTVRVFENGALWEIARDGERTALARLDVTTLDSLLKSLARIRALAAARPPA